MRGAVSTGAAMVRRGFTLIEVLAVIAIVLVVMAISLPAVEGRLAGARFDAAVQRLDSGLAWSRAEAQRRGEAVRVEARIERGVCSLYLAALDVPEKKQDEKGAKEQPFVELDSGLNLSDHGPASVDAPPARAATGSDAAAPLTIGVFLPDGSAMGGSPVYLLGLGRAAKLDVNHWTGGVRVTEVDPKAAANERGDSAPSGDSEGQQ